MDFSAVQWRLDSDRRALTCPRRIGRGIVFFLAVLIALVSYRYVLGLPPVPDGIGSNRYRMAWLPIHAGSAATALLVGGVQFSRAVRARRPGLHRLVGRIYTVSCLVGAAAGFVLAFGTSAGPVAGLGFGGLAVVWTATTALGWRYARTRRFDLHCRWMIRSWALTLSAVTLRLYIPLFALADVPEEPAYRIIAFLAWIPNLLLAEFLLRRSP